MPRLFPTAPDAIALGPGVVRYTRPAMPRILPDLSFDFFHDAAAQVGEIATDWTADGLLLRLRARADTSIAQECLATLAVQRGWHRAFSRGYGIDYERAMRRPSFGQLRADVENQIDDQLRRIVGVRSTGQFVWIRDADRARVRFVVRLLTGASFTLDAIVPPNGGPLSQ
jgi:hypothetical protein